tara:strand:- start:937 stop:1392 length:456 start_codon:yes stop_codon:yes gene_type:complete
MDNEKRPLKKKGGASELESLEEKLARQEERFERNMYCLIGCCLSILIICIVLLVMYFIECSEEREGIDDDPTTVSEKLIDYTVSPHKRVNCTNQHPCVDWNCGYVREHFHRIHDECEYNDWSDWVWWGGIGLFLWGGCLAACGTKAKKESG